MNEILGLVSTICGFFGLYNLMGEKTVINTLLMVCFCMLITLGTMMRQ